MPSSLFFDILLGLLVAAAAAGAVYSIIKHRGTGCGGCSGCAGGFCRPGCGGCDGQNPERGDACGGRGDGPRNG